VFFDSVATVAAEGLILANPCKKSMTPLFQKLRNVSPKDLVIAVTHHDSIQWYE